MAQFHKLLSIPTIRWTIFCTLAAVPANTQAAESGAPKGEIHFKKNEENSTKSTEYRPISTPSPPLPKEASEQIDVLIEAEYAKSGIKPNPPVSDEVFVRRIHLDVIGRTPTRSETEGFLNSDDPEKRSMLIDSLLDSEGYVGHFYNYWADILRINNGLGIGAMSAEIAFAQWVKHSLRINKPYDEFVRELVTASGSIWDNGAVGYHLRDSGMPLDHMSNTARIFLGIRLECAQCHDHPFENWTQMDYYRMAAFGYGIETRPSTSNRKAFTRKQGARLLAQAARKVDIHDYSGEALYQMLYERDATLIKNFKQFYGVRKMVELLKSTRSTYREQEDYFISAELLADDLFVSLEYTAVTMEDRELELPDDYQYPDAVPRQTVVPETIFGSHAGPTEDRHLMIGFGKWLSAPENPTFTRVIANRLWKKVFGVGLIEPVDNFGHHTIASNPQLMAYLEELMRANRYDKKAFLRVLFNTRTYQRQVSAHEANSGTPYHFPGPTLRRMSAEQIWDSLVGLTIPAADLYKPNVKEQLNEIERKHRTYLALENRTAEEFVGMVDRLYILSEGNSKQLEQVMDEYRKAVDESDYRLADLLRHEYLELEKSFDARKAAVMYTYGRTPEFDDTLTLAMAGMTEVSMASARLRPSKYPGAVVTSMQGITFPQPPPGLRQDQQRRWKKTMAEEAHLFMELTKGLVRSSELPSPAPRGHFLREFGQSDREVIQNASVSASVPQALALLNGPASDMITNRLAVFGSDLESADSLESAIDRIFITLFSRPATNPEKQRLLERFGQTSDAPKQIAWVMLNTQQFLFVE